MAHPVTIMKISVIIPYKNAEKWIKPCVESCLQQKGDLEFIFVNDDSDDNGPEIVGTLKDERVHCIYNSNASGVSGARNSGLENAEGEWVTFLDADDELLPNAWKIFGFMTELDETINVIQANHVCGYHDGKPVKVCVNERGMYGPGNLPKAWCMVWNKLYRKSFLDYYGIWFEEGMQYGEDELFNLNCLNYDPRILHTQARTSTVFHTYHNEESLSHIKTRMDLLRQSQALESFLPQCNNATLRRDICMMLADRWSHRLMETWT